MSLLCDRLPFILSLIIIVIVLSLIIKRSSCWPHNTHVDPQSLKMEGNTWHHPPIQFWLYANWLVLLLRLSLLIFNINLSLLTYQEILYCVPEQHSFFKSFSDWLSQHLSSKWKLYQWLYFYIFKLQDVFFVAETTSYYAKYLNLLHSHYSPGF